MYYIYPSEADRRHRHPTGTQVEKFRNEKVHLMWRAHVTGESDSMPSVCTHPGQTLACWLSPRRRGWWRCTPMHLGGPLSQAAGEGSHWVLWSRMCDASGRPVKNTKDSQIWTNRSPRFIKAKRTNSLNHNLGHFVLNNLDCAIILSSFWLFMPGD